MRSALVLALVGLLLGGCTSPEEQRRREVLDAVVAETFDGTVAFNLSLDAPEPALDAFGAAAGPLAGLLAGSSLAGVLEDDGMAAGLSIAGVDLAQLRVIGPGEQYLRFSLVSAGDATGVTGTARRLEAALAGADLEPEAEAAVLASARGEWVRLETAAGDGPGLGVSLRQAFAALLGEATPVAHVGDLDAAVFDGQLDLEVDVAAALGAAGSALAGIVPSAVPSPADGAEPLAARMLVETGMIRSVTLELGGVAGEAVEDEADPDDLEMVLDLRRLDPEEPLVEAPEVTATVTLEQLERAAAAVSEVVQGSNGQAGS